MTDAPSQPEQADIARMVADAENIGTTALIQGDVDNAARVFEELIQIDPKNAIAWNGMGQVALHRKDLGTAEKLLKKATQLRADWAEPYIHLAGLFLHQNRTPRAQRMLRHAHEHVGEDADGLYVLSRFHQQLGDLKAAQATLEAALVINRTHPGVCNDLGSLYALSGNIDAAETLFRTALNTDGANHETRVNLGRLLAMKNDLDAASTEFQLVLEKEPEHIGALIGIASAKRRKRDLTSALLDAERAASLDPENAIALNLIGIIYRELGDFEASRGAFNDSLKLNPDIPSTRANLGMLTLLEGKWAEGWDDYESRLSSSETRSQWGHVNLPMWNGEDLTGKHIIVFSEQGFGDSIQFSRYLPQIAMDAEKVSFAVQPELRSLLKGQLPGVELIGEDTTLQNVHAQINLLSIPRALKIAGPKQIKGAAYLTATRHSDIFGECENLPGLKVGLNWTGNKDHTEDAKRSISLRQLAPLFDLPDISWVNLNMTAKELPADMVDLRAKIGDFSDAADLMAALDLVISVDTATVHLAGALGVSCWTLISKIPDWRWGMTGETTPWYDSMRLWRQSERDDWDSVISDMAVALKDFPRP